ncbi:glycosyltransferase [Alloalcanivorax gelatiniphagus]
MAKYLKYLGRDAGLHIDIVTSKNPTLYMPYDSSLEVFLRDVRQIINLPLLESRYTNVILRKIFPSIMSMPDSKKSFSFWAYLVCRNLKESPDIIYSRSYPLSSTMMAYRLQQHYRCPWVLHLSDPWTINPLRPSEPAKDWNATMESRCFSAATILSFTSDKTLLRYAELYPNFAHKMVVFPNVFDPDDLKDKRWKKKKKMKLVYTGGLVGTRTPKIIVDAFNLIRAYNKDVLSKIEVVLAGEVDRGVKKILEDQNLGIKHVGLLAFDQAIELQSDADILLLIDTPTKNSDDAMFFPSKLLDYMLAGRRVIAVTDRGSCTADVVRNSGLGDVVDHNDAEGLMNIIIKSFKSWELSEEDHFSRGSADEFYSAKNQASRLIDLFHEKKQRHDRVK